MDKVKQARLLELRQKKNAAKKQAEQQKHLELVEAVKSLHSLFSESKKNEAITTEMLLEKLSEFSSFKEEVAEVKKAIEALDNISISNLSELIDAQKDVDFSEVTNAVKKLTQAVADQSVTIKNQKADEYIPTRRVIQMNGRLIFDDKPMEVTVVGGGGAMIAGVQPSLIQDDRVKVDIGGGIDLGDVTVAVDAVGVKDASDVRVDPSTIGKQNEQIALLEQLVAKLGVYVDNEIPVGVKNLNNRIFDSQYDYKPGTLKIYFNGTRLQEGPGNDYVENGGSQFTLSEALTPRQDDIIIIDYMKL